MNKTKILVCCHKKDPAIRKTEIYEPLHVGKAINNQDLGFIGDDTGENISHKNPQYCEITALYWAWKSMKPTDYVGFAHYRRYFDSSITEESVPEILQKSDVITCDDVCLSQTNFYELSHWTSLENSYILFDTLLKQHPEYSETLYNYSWKSIKWTPCNMFISSWKWMQEYCEWLFPILEEMERRMKPSPYTRQKRTIGYMAEYLLGIYIHYNKSKVHKVRMDIIQNNGKILQPSVKYKVLYRRHKIAFWICNRKSMLQVFKDIIKRIIGRKVYSDCTIPIVDSIEAGLKTDGITLDAIHNANEKLCCIYKNRK